MELYISRWPPGLSKATQNYRVILVPAGDEADGSGLPA